MTTVAVATTRCELHVPIYKTSPSRKTSSRYQAELHYAVSLGLYDVDLDEDAPNRNPLTEPALPPTAAYIIQSVAVPSVGGAGDSAKLCQCAAYARFTRCKNELAQ